MFAKKLSNDEQLDEKVLLHKVVNGDYNAFATLYETNVRQVTNYALKFTNDIQIIEDSTLAESYSVLQGKVANVLGLLSSKQKEVFLSKVLSGFSFDEITNPG